MLCIHQVTYRPQVLLIISSCLLLRMMRFRLRHLTKAHSEVLRAGLKHFNPGAALQHPTRLMPCSSELCQIRTNKDLNMAHNPFPMENHLPMDLIVPSKKW